MATCATYPEISERLQTVGLRARGGFDVEPSDGLPDAVRMVVLVGNIGGSLWSAFDGERRDVENPLDDWSKRTLGRITIELPGAVGAVFPSDGPPYYTFQQWALRAEPVHPSPLGPLIHPDYGLWHAYRGALLFDREIAGVPDVMSEASPCSSCVGKPCLTACPVGAIDQDEGGLDVMTCAAHLKTKDGKACLACACLARRACPVGAEYRYQEPQSRFHMEAFLRARG